MSDTADPKSRRLPPWMRVSLKGTRARGEVRSILRNLSLHSVCESAHCPNIHECWRNKTATFLLLGNVCTRNCRFCAIANGKPPLPDPAEPEHVATAIEQLDLRYAVLTCVTRDDLPDGGAAHLAQTINAIRTRRPETGIEVLPSDFAGKTSSLDILLQTEPDVFNHNIETIERLTPLARDPRAGYRCSLKMLKHGADFPTRRPMRIKSGIMLGMGETTEEIRTTFADLRQAGVEILTVGQYLPPSDKHFPLDRQVPPEEFDEWGEIGRREFGFTAVISGPMVRSSYLAEQAMRPKELEEDDA